MTHVNFYPLLLYILILLSYTRYLLIGQFWICHISLEAYTLVLLTLAVSPIHWFDNWQEKNWVHYHQYVQYRCQNFALWCYYCLC